MSLDKFELDAARARCRGHRRRILDISQKVPALHVAPAFSCIEMLDFAYHHLIRPHDILILSKGHGAIAQYVVLEDLGVLPTSELDKFGTKDGIGTHPDRGTPGVIASTGSLGHGLGMAVGVALVEKMRASDHRVVVLMSDGELFEGSTWEALLQASSRDLTNLIVMIDANGWTSSGRIREEWPTFEPLPDKLHAFGWVPIEVPGHHLESYHVAMSRWARKKPLAMICRTVKGKGVSFMQDNPIWAYRSPSAEEYARAIKEVG